MDRRLDRRRGRGARAPGGRLQDRARNAQARKAPVPRGRPAIVDYNMIEDGDKVMVCMSGGKDSYALLDILLKLQGARADPLRPDRGQPRPEAARLSRACAARVPERALGVPFHIENQDTYSIVKRVIPEGKTTCSLCSRLRRGILYRVADELGATKIALGHHRDDILQTFFLNMFFGGKLKSMPPKLVSDDGRHVVIRPLAYVAEKRPGALGAAPRLPDHSVHPVRQPGEPAAQAGRRDAARLGEEIPRPRGEHVQRVAERRAVAPARRTRCTTSRVCERHRRGRRRTATRPSTPRNFLPRRACPACRWCGSPEASAAAPTASHPRSCHEMDPMAPDVRSTGAGRLHRRAPGRQRRAVVLAPGRRARDRHLPLRAPALAAGAGRAAIGHRGPGRAGHGQGRPARTMPRAPFYRAQVYARTDRHDRAPTGTTPGGAGAAWYGWGWARLLWQPGHALSAVHAVPPRGRPGAARGGERQRGLRNPCGARRALERRPGRLRRHVRRGAQRLSAAAAGRAPRQRRDPGRCDGRHPHHCRAPWRNRLERGHAHPGPPRHPAQRHRPVAGRGSSGWRSRASPSAPSMPATCSARTPPRRPWPRPRARR